MASAFHHKSQYLTVLNFNGKEIFYENTPKERRTVVHVDGQRKFIFPNSGVNHNFSPFIVGEKVYAIGGQESWKNDKEITGITSGEAFIRYWEDRFKRPFEQNLAFANKALSFLKRSKHPLKHTHGLYLFESKNGVDFKQVQEKPIISALHPGYISALAWKSGEFDGHIHVVKFGELFHIFIRANIDRGQRFVQYATSTDLLEWSPFKILPLPHDPAVNTYFLCGASVRDKHYFFLPKFDAKDSWIEIYEAEGVEKIRFIKELFRKPAAIFTEKTKNVDHPINGTANGKFFFCHNYMQADMKVKGYKYDAIL
jgi:hypothetical protein